MTAVTSVEASMPKACPSCGTRYPAYALFCSLDGALLTTFPGDTTMATLDQVKAFAKGGSARIQR